MVELNKTFWLRTITLSLMLAWPLIVFGRPAYISDSMAYVKGGEVAVSFVERELRSASSSSAASAVSTKKHHSGEGDETLRTVNGARSAWYSAASYLLRGPETRMVPLVLVQILTTAFTIVLAMEAFGPLSRPAFLATSSVLAIATPLPLVANLVVPDLFAGLMVLGMLVVLYANKRLSFAAKLFLLALITFCVAAHASVPPLALGLLILALAWRVWNWTKTRYFEGQALVTITLSVALGITLTAIAGLIAFGEASVAPKRFPLALARSISDGPARWYLEEECKAPRYAVCEVFGTRFPRTVSGFVFQDGLEDRASPEQMDRIRAEEREIVLNAALRYPATEIGNLATNIVRQIYRFENRIAFFDNVVIVGSDGVPRLEKHAFNRKEIFTFLDWISFATAGAALLALTYLFSRLNSRYREMLLLLAGAICANAVIVVVFSGIAARYQARLIWLIPLIASILAFAEKYRSTRDKQEEASSPCHSEALEN